jgi:hypothetical protein
MHRKETSLDPHSLDDINSSIMLDTAFILSATLGTVALLSIIGYFIG